MSRLGVADRPDMAADVPLAAATRGVPAWQIGTLLTLVGVAWFAFTWALLQQHRTYSSNAFDLGFFDQIIWNTAQGRPFETSFVRYNFLGQHMEPVLLLYAAAYRVRPDVEILLMTQAAVAAGAAIPLFIAARRLLESGIAALLIAAAYLIAPHLHGAVLFDFHPEVMGAAGIFGAFALLAAGRPGWAMAALGTVFLLKEDAALVGLGFALVVWLFGYRRWALALAGASLLYLVVVAGLVMPAIRGGPGDLQERYGYLGADTGEIAATALTRPDLVLRHLLAPESMRGLLYLVGAQALLPLASPASFAAAPLLAANMLSTHPPQHDLTLHYPILPFALLMVGATMGTAWLARDRRLAGLRRRLGLSPARATIVVTALLLAAEATGWLLGSPLGQRRFDGDRYRRNAHHTAVDRIVAFVPPGLPVSAQSGILPHLSQRRDVWEFPRLENADYVVVDPSAWRSLQSTDAGYERVMFELPSLGFCLLREEDGVRLYGKGAACASP